MVTQACKISRYCELKDDWFSAFFSIDIAWYLVARSVHWVSIVHCFAGSVQWLQCLSLNNVYCASHFYAYCCRHVLSVLYWFQNIGIAHPYFYTMLYNVLPTVVGGCQNRPPPEQSQHLCTINDSITVAFLGNLPKFCIGTTLDGVIVTSDTSQVHDPSSNSCFFATTTHLALGRTLVIIILYIVFYYAIIIQCMHVYI